MRYLGSCLVIDYDTARLKGFKARGVKQIPQKEIHFPSDIVFPFAIARKMSIERMQLVETPDAVAPLVPLPRGDEAADAEALPGDESTGPPKLAKPGFKITLVRIFQYGGTVGCRACEQKDTTKRHCRV